MRDPLSLGGLLSSRGDVLTSFHKGVNSTIHACVYVLQFNTEDGLERAENTRAELKRQGIKFNIMSSRYPDRDNWPVTCLNHNGYIGMWRTYLAAWTRATHKCKAKWAIFLESDAVLPKEFNTSLVTALEKHRFSRAIWLDERNGFRGEASNCCTVATAWHRSTWSILEQDFSPYNPDAWHNGYEKNATRQPIIKNPVCLTDWYLGNVVVGRNIKASCYGVVKHPNPQQTRSEIGSSSERRR